MIRDKIHRICDSFTGQRFDLPPANHLDEKIEQIKYNRDQAKKLYDESKKTMKEYLKKMMVGK